MASRRFTLGSIAILILFFGGCYDRGEFGTAPPESEARDEQSAASRDSVSLVARIELALKTSRWEEARQLSKQALLIDSNDPRFLTYAARAAAGIGERSEAAELLRQAAAADEYASLQTIELAVRASLDVGEIYPALDVLRQSIAVDPMRHEHRRLLLGFLGEAGLNAEARPHYERVIRDRKFDVALLVGFTDLTIRRFPSETATTLFDRNGEDHRIRLAIAQQLRDDRLFESAVEVLREILEHHLEFAAAHALLGQSLVDAGRIEELADWAHNANAESESLADYWLTLGDWAMEQEQFAAAARAYWTATQRDINHVAAWTRLTRVLQIMVEDDSLKSKLPTADRSTIEDCEERVRGLLEVKTLLDQFAASEESSQSLSLRIATALADLGRLWEAEAWAAIATTLTEDLDPSVSSTRQQIIERLRRDPQWVSKAGHPSLALDLSDLPALDIAQRPPPGTRDPAERPRPVWHPENDSTDHWAFNDETESRGLKIPRQVYPDISTALIHSMGTGGGALDFDQDGWVDLMLACSGGEMMRSNSASNRLLRNVDGKFQDVTEFARVVDQRFGQAVAVGDFNADGWDDVFVGNIDSNQLLRNNGDGTFSDASELLKSDSRQWTTGAGFVDLNEDGLADLVVVNYCDVSSGIDKPCSNPDGKSVACHPARYPAAPDEVFIAQPEGALVPLSEAQLPVVEPGRGLGVLAGRLSGKNNSVLIANDMTVNHLLAPVPRTKNGSMVDRFQEGGIASGLAVDDRALPQASMGIAASDLDGDGDLDLYVTGFAFEYNIYYRQDSPGRWVDATGSQGLLQPTVSSVGFGTEAIDVDGDGIDELIVTNGHIGDFGADSPPLRQPLQLFRRNSSGVFDVVDVSTWGDYFSTPHIGRALWLADIDRDLRPDVIITHQDEPPRLLCNRTENDHHRIGFRLVGTQSPRGSVGATVRFRCGQQARALWSLSGSGYMCHNESLLTAGLGNSQDVADVTVTWPNGVTESFGDLPADQLHLLVESSGKAFSMEP